MCHVFCNFPGLLAAALLWCSGAAAQCLPPDVAINITITTEGYGGLTAWQLLDADGGQVYGSQNGYSDFETVQHSVCVPQDSHLLFEVSCCNNAQGAFTVEMLGFTVAQGSTYQNGTSYTFTAGLPAGYDLAVSTANLGGHMLKGRHHIEVGIANAGEQTITSFNLHWSENGAAAGSMAVSGVSIPPFGTYAATLPDVWEASTGLHSLQIWTDSPNGQTDQNTGNDTLSQHVQVVPFLSERTVLFEHFTNASCSNCEFADPQLNDLINSNAINMAPVNYHTGFPGYDPMYLQSAEFVNARLGYYPPLGVPTAVIDGGLLTAPTPTVQTTQIYGLQQRPALFNLAASEDLLLHGPDSGRLARISIHITPSVDIAAGNYALRIALVEKDVSYDTPPGSANLTYFNYVLRSMLPDAGGLPLPEISAGETHTFALYANLPDFADKNELRTIAFVQNESTREVAQALETTLKTGKAQNGNTIVSGGFYGNLIVDIQPANCQNGQGQITVENEGYAPPVSYLWDNGVTLQTSSLAAGMHSLTVTDGYGNSELHHFAMPARTDFDYVTNVEHDLDDSGTGSIGILPFTGQSPFSYLWQNGETSPSIGGLAAGSYALTVTDGFGCERYDLISVDNVTNANSLPQSGGWGVLPNPAGGFAVLRLPDLANYTHLDVQFLDLSGKVVFRKTSHPSGGERTLRLELGGLASGVYLLHLNAFSVTGKVETYGQKVFKQ